MDGVVVMVVVWFEVVVAVVGVCNAVGSLAVRYNRNATTYIT